MELDKAPIIVIGMHRSGTTLLSQLLENNKIDFGINKEKNNESHFFLKLNEFLLSYFNSHWYDVKNLKKHINKKYILKFLKNELNYRNLCKHHFTRKEAINWGWKDPRTTIFIEYYSKIFNKAKIIHIVRNPYDVALSLQNRQLKIKKQFFLKRLIRKLYNKFSFGYSVHDSDKLLDLTHNFKLWNNYVVSGRSVKNRIDIRYEDLLHSPEKISIKISEFIGQKINLDSSKIKSKNSSKNLQKYKSIDINKYISEELLREYNYLNFFNEF